MKSWYRRHLNWTFLLLLYGGVALSGYLGYVSALLWGVWLEAIRPIVSCLACIVLLSAVIFPPVWLLRHKNRRLWNLLWYITGFGVLIMLCLHNDTKVSGKEVGGNE